MLIYIRKLHVWSLLLVPSNPHIPKMQARVELAPHHSSLPLLCRLNFSMGLMINSLSFSVTSGSGML